jgi:hypothetical protein
MERETKFELATLVLPKHQWNILSDLDPLWHGDLKG